MLRARVALVMRKHAVVVTLTLLELLAALLLAFFWLVMRPDLVATYGLAQVHASGGGAHATDLPVATRLVLATPLVPIVGAAGFVVFASAWVFARGVNARNRLLGAALVITVLDLAWAVWAAYGPAFEHL